MLYVPIKANNNNNNNNTLKKKKKKKCWQSNPMSAESVNVFNVLTQLSRHEKNEALKCQVFHIRNNVLEFSKREDEYDQNLVYNLNFCMQREKSRFFYYNNHKMLRDNFIS